LGLCVRALGVWGRVAAFGKFGENPKMLHQGLVRLFGIPAGAPDFTWVLVPTTRGEVFVPVLLPHEFFGRLHASRRALWEQAIRGPADAAKAFWDFLQDTPMVRDHPYLPNGRRHQTIPLGLHGDAGPFTKQDGVFVISWNSLIGGEAGEGFAKRFLFAVIRKADLVPGTLDALWTVFAWSANALLTGISPEVDWAQREIGGGGDYIAGGFRGAVVQLRGDWEFYCQIFKFPYWHEAERMCWLCKASNTIERLLWTSVGADAGWRSTRMGQQEYMDDMRARGRAVPVLLSLVIGLTVTCVMIDVLHAVDLGVASHVIGHIFWRCVTMRAWGGRTNEENMKKLEMELNEWYKERKEKSQLQGKLTIARVRTDKGWPKLKAKGAATRHLAEFALVIAKKYLGTSTRERKELAVIQCLVNFYRIISSEGMYLSDEAKRELPKVGNRLCALYGSLAREMFTLGQKFWKMNPKMHLFLHLCEWVVPELGLNPRQYWCYADEDVVGQLVEVARTSHVRSLAATCLFKWLLLAFE